VRKTLGLTLTTTALWYAASAPAPSSTMTTLAEDNGTANDQDSDKTGPVGPGGPSWSARTRRTQGAQQHQRRPLAGAGRAWQPEHPPALER